MKQFKFKIRAGQILPMALVFSLQMMANDMYGQKNAKDSIVAAETKRTKRITFPPCCRNANITVIGLVNGEPLLQTEKGVLLVIDVQSGLTKEVNKEEYENMRWTPLVPKPKEAIVAATKDNSAKAQAKTPYLKIKEIAELTVVGIDTDSHVILQNAKGEKFVIHPTTGDMVDYVGHVTLLR
jgi:hypothetical protein